jgi:flavin reductase (DIM6/NTAB) family NADH-FMN oxidoreductase RutF
MLKINPSETPLPKLHQYILGAIAPRPIAFASTMDKSGKPNLAPFSFFNAFGSNPPILVFSPARSGRDNTTKNTLDNVTETKEVVINVVNYNIVQQMSLASGPYPKGVNEFIKSGLTPIASEIVKPFRVKESIVQMECKVLNVIHTGDKGGAGNLIICEILLMHIEESVLNADGNIDPYKAELVARMGGDYYCKVTPESIFVLPQPKDKCGMGVDVLPESIRKSSVLTGNNLGQLGSFYGLPSMEEVRKSLHDTALVDTLTELSEDVIKLHQFAKLKLDSNDAWEGFKILMLKEYDLI